MIIRKCTTKTLKASSLINRGREVPPGSRHHPLKHSERVPVLLDGRPLQGRCSLPVGYPGVLATLVPSVLAQASGIAES